MPHLAIPPSPCSMSSPCLTEMTSRKEMLPFSSLSDGCGGQGSTVRGGIRAVATVGVATPWQADSAHSHPPSSSAPQGVRPITLPPSPTGQRMLRICPIPRHAQGTLPSGPRALSFTVPRAPPCRRPLQRLKHRNSPCISERGNYPQTWLGPLCHLPRTLHEGRRGQGKEGLGISVHGQGHPL